MLHVLDMHAERYSQRNRHAYKDILIATLHPPTRNEVIIHCSNSSTKTYRQSYVPNCWSVRLLSTWMPINWFARKTSFQHCEVLHIQVLTH